jgi:hypothetical protein
VPDGGAPGQLTEVLAGGPKERVAYSLANGFPIWYRDENGLALELCLEQWVELATTLVHPCLTAEPFLGAPISFPANFGAEALWWAAATFGTFVSQIGPGPVLFPVLSGEAILFMGVEAGFAQDLLADGNQASRARIQVHFETPLHPAFVGTYRVTHPYGVAIYEVNDFLAVQQRHDVGNLVDLAHRPPPPSGPPPAGPPPAGDFTLALEDGPDPATLVLPPDFPAADAGYVSSVATRVGPFLVPADPLERVTALDGSTYLADPGTEVAPRMVPVTGSPFGTNFLRIEFLDPPPGVWLNAGNPLVAGDESNVVQLDLFQVTGKLFDGGPNLAPLAVDDAVRTPPGVPILIDVLENDADPVGAGNAHGLHPQALGLPLDDGTILLTRPLTTTAGGTVQRFTETTTGKTSFLYTPAPGFSGVDGFRYVVQDRGGLVSAPATVTVTVRTEDLAVAAAEYRARTGRWRVAGQSSDPTDNTIVLYGGPRAPLAAAPAASTTARGGVSLRIAPAAVEFRLALDPLPPTPVTEVHVHAGAPDGPIVFVLYDRIQEPALSGSKSGTLTEAELFPGFGGFDDVVAAILAGEVWVDVHTAGNAAGELRGQLVMPVIGTAPVDPATGSWRFAGKASVSPGSPATVNARSANDVWTLGVPLRLR